MTVQDVDDSQNLSGKNIAAFKGDANQINLNVVARDQLNIPVVLIKFHKEVFLTYDILFVKKIPFFLTLSRKIYFT